MRGIAGIIRFDQGPVSPGDLDRMIRTMAIGPTDRIGTWCEGSAGLAHLIQFLLPEDRYEQQPLASATRDCVLVTDALLDNRDELAAAFGWDRERAAREPDSAYVLAAFEKWGDACPERLSGRFAFAIWQPRERRLFCATDPYGCQPVYYWTKEGMLAFATTLKGLFSLPQVPRRLHEPMLAEHMAGLRRIIPDTLYRDVFHLLGGHALVVRGTGEVRLQRYWNPSPDRELRLGSDAEYLAAFRHELDAAVRRSLARTPGKVGLLLSGGLDSTAVAVVAGKQLAAQGRRLQAIHRVPPSGNRYRVPLRELDESHYVELFRRAASYIDFHFLENDPPVTSPEEWDQFFSDNFVPFDTFPLTTDQKWNGAMASLGISGLLDGIGGNLLVSLEAHPSGYLEHLAASARWPTWWRELRGHHRIYGRPLRDLVRETAVNPLRRWWRGPAAFDPAANSQLMLLHPALRRRTEIEQRWREDRMKWSQSPRDFRRRLHRVLTEVTAQQIGVAPSVITRERVTMLGSSPLFDRRLNEFCLALPFEQQIRHGWDRRLLRESLRDDAPDDVRLRVTRGFPQPEFQSLFAQMQPALNATLDRIRSSSIATELLDYNRLRTLWNERSENASLETELTLLRGITLGAFLLWHEQTGSL